LAKKGRRQGKIWVMNRRTRVRELFQGEGERGMNGERNEKKRDGYFDKSSYPQYTVYIRTRCKLSSK
jgi:hypothetical protein